MRSFLMIRLISRRRSAGWRALPVSSRRTSLISAVLRPALRRSTPSLKNASFPLLAGALCHFRIATARLRAIVLHLPLPPYRDHLARRLQSVGGTGAATVGATISATV